MFNAPPPTASQIKSVRHAMIFRAPSFQGRTISNFGQLLQTPSIDDLGRPPQQLYPIQPGAPIIQQPGTEEPQS